MAKDGKKKVQSRTTPKYTTSSDEGSSSEDEDDPLTLFANLNMQQKEKLNELIGVIHKKDQLLDSQEEFLIKENKKHVKLKNAYAQEVENCENLAKELSICHDSITSLRNENTSLNAKIDKLNESISSLRNENASLISKVKDLNVCNNSISCLRDENVMLKSKIDELNVCKPSTSTVEHISICTRCRDVNVDAIKDHHALIKQQNDHIAQLTAKINEQEIENENFKFARSMLYNRRRPGIKDGVGFQQGSNVKINAPKKTSYELLTGKNPNVSYFRVFGSKCFILVKIGRKSKFAPKVVEGFLLGYDSNTRAYRVFNKSTGLVEVSYDIMFDETNGSQVEQVDLDDLDDEEAPCVALRNMSIGDVCPKESKEPTQA
jgi:hypothetical protein